MNVMGMCSPNELRKILQKGLNELLRVLPEGEEPTLEVPKAFRDSFLVTDTNRTALIVLSVFFRTISAFSDYLPEETVRRIMSDEGGIQAILAGDQRHINYLVQKYLD